MSDTLRTRVETMSSHVPLEQLIESAVTAYYEGARENKFDAAEFRLSETGDCPRKRVLRALGHEPTHPPSDVAMRQMEAGKLWETWLVGRLACDVSTEQVDCQVVVPTPYNASGHVDALVRRGEEVLLVEVKAVSQWAKELPEARHVAQVQAYLHFLRQEGLTPKAQLCYFHRETGAGPFVHDVVYDPEAGAQIEKDLQALTEAIKLENVPPIPDGMEAQRFPCSWTSRTGGGHCPMYGHCWGDNKA